jgi:hypothetical protein
MDTHNRRQSLTGVTGGPPLPANVPAPGFVVERNAGEFDEHGNLRRQWVKTKPDSGPEYEIPEGHVVKGESALVDPDGRVLARWVKTRENGAPAIIEALKTAFAEYEGKSLPSSAAYDTDADILTLYPLPDLHIGMYAWGDETGANYDVDIAVKQAEASVAALVAQSRPSEKAVILGLGDYFHANDAKALTPGSGHSLDVDGRWPKVYAAGAKLAISIIDLAAQKHQSVEVVFLPGNHDPDAAVTLTVALHLYYSNNPRVTIRMEPGMVWYHRFGRCLLGATHGHSIKPDKMAMLLANDCAEDWGQTVHRHFFFGHVHHESVKEVGSVKVESFNSPAARDAWNAGQGYRAGRSMNAVTFHKERGEIGRHRLNIIPTKPKTRVKARAA